MICKQFENSRRLSVMARELIASFNMLIAIIVVTWVSSWMKGRYWQVGCVDSTSEEAVRRGGSTAVVETNVTCTIGNLLLLNVPAEFGTTSGRAWIVPFWELTDTSALGQALLYGLLLALLFFVEQNITSVMLDKPENKLAKKPSFHWDMFLVGILVAISGLFGLPVAHASLPHSLYHVRALANKQHHPPTTLQRNYRVSVKGLIWPQIASH